MGWFRFLLVTILGLIVLSFSVINAQAKITNGCTEDNRVCWGPALSASVLICDADGCIVTDNLGIGFGMRFLNDKPYALGIDLFVDYDIGNGNNRTGFSVVGSAFKLLRVGVRTEIPGPDVSAVIGLGFDFKSP